MRDTLRGFKAVASFWGICLFLVVVFFSATSRAAINPQINFQGKLANPDGTNVTNGTYSMVFRIYTVSSGGAAVWTETQSSVSVVDGIFRVALGSVTSLPGSVDFNGASLFLGITVGADAEMTPRIQFTASPYAFNSDRLSGLTSTNFVQLGQNSSPQTDSSTNSSVFINKTASGNLVQLQSSGVDALSITNAGDILFGQNANHTISVAAETANVSGNNLTLSAGQGGPGAGNTGGLLTVQGGSGGGTNGAGGDVLLSGGAATGTAAVGAIIVRSPANSQTAFQIQNASSALQFVVDTTNSRVVIGNPTADGTAVFLVLDSRNVAANPTGGVNGAMYYNSALNTYSCYRGINTTPADGRWEVCGTTPVERSYEIYDEFMGGTTTSGNIGSLGWNFSNIASAPAFTYNNATPAPTADRPGILRMRTAATANNGGTMQLTGTAAAGALNIGVGMTMRSAATVAATGAGTQVIRLGLHNQTTTTASPTTGVWFEYDPAASTTLWRYCYHNGAAATCANSTVALTANVFNSLEIRVNSLGVNSSSADYFIDGIRFSVSGITINTTNRVSPAMACYTLAATARDCFIDYYQLTYQTSARR